MSENKTIHIRPEIQIFGVGPEGITSAGEIPDGIRKLIENIEATFRTNEEQEKPEKQDKARDLAGKLEMREIEEATDKIAFIDSCYCKALMRRGFTEEQAFEMTLARAAGGK